MIVKLSLKIVKLLYLWTLNRKKIVGYQKTNVLNES